MNLPAADEMPDTHNNREGYGGLAALIVIVTGLWLLSGWALYSRQDRGTFGDMFGAVNALFSGLAFATLIYTIFLQRKELSLQRQELSLTRNELEGQKLQLSAQNDVLRTQNFENTFFQLLKLLNDIISSVDYANHKGRNCFNIFFRNLRDRYKGKINQNPDKDRCKVAKDVSLDFYKERQTELAHYFRTLYNIVKFIHESEVSNKKFYTNLVRAQLSSQELLLIFYNCASPLGSEKFKPLIEKYGLFKMLPKEYLLDPEEHLSLFSEAAYGASK